MNVIIKIKFWLSKHELNTILIPSLDNQRMQQIQSFDTFIP